VLRNDDYTILDLQKNNQQPVSYSAGEQMATRIDAKAYLECSALTRDGVRGVFEAAARAALQRKANNGRESGCQLI